MNESEEFPNGEFDDMVDSMSQALEYLRSKVKVVNSKMMGRKYKRRKRMY